MTDADRAAAYLLTWPTAQTGFRSDFCGIRLPGLGLVNDLAYTPPMACYSRQAQRAICVEFATRGYTRMPINVGGEKPYGDYYPALPNGYANPSLYDPLVTLLASYGITPVIFVCEPSFGPDPSTYATGILEHFTGRAEFSVGWEINDWLTEAQMYAATEWIASKVGKVWMHFTPDHAAISSPEADSWARIQPWTHGILLQTDVGATVAIAADTVQQFTMRLKDGFHGWPHPLKVIWFEVLAYKEFHDGLSEAYAVQFVRDVLAQVTPPVDGFGNGG